MASVKCPKCAREFVRRSSRAGWFEKLLSWFHVYPFKCQLCGLRFRFLQRGVRYTRVVEDRRLYDRLDLTCPITFSGEGVVGEGTVMDISMGGCSFSTGEKLMGDAIIALSLKVSEETTPLRIDAAVVRYVGEESAGVEFLRWPPGERERLQQLMRGLLIKRHG